MQTRFCPRCRAKVEDVGGYCLLGHSFPEENDLLREIRAEVNAAFERAKIQIDSGFTVEDDPAEEQRSEELQPAMVAAPSAIRELAAENGARPTLEELPGVFRALAEENSDPVLTEADVVARRRARATAAWKQLQDQRPAAATKSNGDPISAFAPAPRMDWGPKPSRIRRFAKDKRQPGTA